MDSSLEKEESYILMSFSHHFTTSQETGFLATEISPPVKLNSIHK